ncbi:MAG: 3-phosphoshikimate 1-carboxyvinyltransferase [Bacteroidaceae bacterium]|nr:3-phosphoshikimate 1-carboxyvinyltransferase [Bacteroidaceae bacterium]
MQITLTPPRGVHTTIALPSSKSISNRVLVINALSGSVCMPENVSDCDDTRVMVRALTEDNPVVDIMAAGTAMRFLTAYFATVEGCTKTMTGTERMRQRPIKVLVDALRQLGARVEYAENEGFPPLLVKGGALEKERVTLLGNVSSQYISALLMIGPMLKSGLTLHLEGEVISRPYINLTLQLMRDFGAEADWVADDEIKVSPIPYNPIPFTVESDWSAASYWYEMVALTSDANAEVVLPNLYARSYQGDSAVARLFEQLGVSTHYDECTHRVTLRKNGRLAERMEYDFINQPDLAQTFVVTCCMLNVPFRFTGLQSLKIKETDRMAALIRELGKLGYVLCEEDDRVLEWTGERCQPEEDAVIDTYEDHRMAMAFAPACMVLGELCVRNPQVVSKSYPRYWEDLQKAGFIIKEQ